MQEHPNNPIGGGGWVHDVAFSHNGNRLAWVSRGYSYSYSFLSKVMVNASNRETAFNLQQCPTEFVRMLV